MKRILEMSLVTLGLMAPGFGAAVIYAVNSAGDLDQITVTGSGTGATFSVTNEGLITGTSGVVSDIAELNGVLYVTTLDALYVLSGTTATEVGSGYGSGITSMVALTFGPNGTLYGAEEGTSEDYYTINTTTGVATGHSTGSEIDSAGDLEVVGNTLYVTTGGFFGASSLGEINLTTNAFTNLGSTGHDEVYGLAIADGTLFGFLGGTTGEVLVFSSTAPGSGYTVTEIGATGMPEIYGATDNVVTPEPATLGLLGAGLIGFGMMARRKR